MELSNLEKIGLKNKEARVYLILLKRGSSLAKDISTSTEILRSSIYDYLDVLLKKGFISYTIKAGKKYFQAVSPEKILDNFNEQKIKEEEALKQMTLELSKLKNVDKKESSVEVYEGKEGMKSVMSYILKEKPNEILIYGSSGVSYKLLPFYMEHWHKERVQNKIPLRIIYNNLMGAKERIKEGPKLKLTQIKLLNSDNISITGTIIYNNKVLITIWNLDNPLAIAIENKEITRSYKDNFENLWKMAEK